MLWVNNSHFVVQACRVAVQTHADEIDVSMLDSLVSWITPLLAPLIDQLPTRILPPQEPGYGLFATADGQQITLSIAGEDPMWAALCKLFERNQFALLCEQQRSARAGEIGPYLREAITRWPYDALYQALEASGIAFGPVRRLHQGTGVSAATCAAHDAHTEKRCRGAETCSPTAAVRQRRRRDHAPGTRC